MSPTTTASTTTTASPLAPAQNNGKRNYFNVGKELFTAQAKSRRPRARKADVRDHEDIPVKSQDSTEGCRWGDCQFTGPAAMVLRHVRTAHKSPGTVTCLWAQCGKTVKAGSFYRHLASHLLTIHRKCVHCGVQQRHDSYVVNHGLAKDCLLAPGNEEKLKEVLQAKDDLGLLARYLRHRSSTSSSSSASSASSPSTLAPCSSAHVSNTRFAPYPRHTATPTTATSYARRSTPTMGSLPAPIYAHSDFFSFPSPGVPPARLPVAPGLFQPPSLHQPQPVHPFSLGPSFWHAAIQSEQESRSHPFPILQPLISAPAPIPIQDPATPMTGFEPFMPVQKPPSAEQPTQTAQADGLHGSNWMIDCGVDNFATLEACGDLEEESVPPDLQTAAQADWMSEVDFNGIDFSNIDFSNIDFSDIFEADAFAPPVEPHGSTYGLTPEVYAWQVACSGPTL